MHGTFRAGEGLPGKGKEWYLCGGCPVEQGAVIFTVKYEKVANFNE